MQGRNSFCLGILAALSGFFCGCADFKAEVTHLSHATHAAIITHLTPAHPEAQKAAYDRAMKYYSAENYVEAKKSWQEAVDDGPATELGRKSQENVDKVDKMLKTLDEIQSK